MKKIFIIIFYLFLLNNSASALVEVDINRGNLDPLPIAVSPLYLEPGSYIKVEDAILALIIKSANDVATVVSENISGSEQEFSKLMTEYARNLGMNNTNFKNASGLHNKSQLTTARDIATLSHALIKNFPKNSK